MLPHLRMRERYLYNTLWESREIAPFIDLTTRGTVICSGIEKPDTGTMDSELLMSNIHRKSIALDILT